jgi:hypothetical protein
MERYIKYVDGMYHVAGFMMEWYIKYAGSRAHDGAVHQYTSSRAHDRAVRQIRK